MVDGRAYAVDVARVGDIWSLLVASAEPVLSSPALRPGRSYEVMIDDQAGGELAVYVNGRAVPVSIHGPTGTRTQRRPARPDRTGEARSGPVNVAAPMPGRIVKVLVNEGDAVVARQRRRSRGDEDGKRGARTTSRHSQGSYGWRKAHSSRPEQCCLSSNDQGLGGGPFGG